MAALHVVLPGDGPPCAEPEFYGSLPATPVADTNIPDWAFRVFAALVVLARGSKTWVQVPLEAIAAAAGKSAPSTQRALAFLRSKGIIEWDSIGRRFQLLFRLRGKDGAPSAPGPRIADLPPTAPPVAPPVKSRVTSPVAPPVKPETAVPPSPPIGEHAPAGARGNQREREKDDDRGESLSSIESTRTETEDTEAVVHEPAYNPRAPLEECPDGDELVNDLVTRACDLWGHASREAILADIRTYGESVVVAAIEHCESKNYRGSSYAYARGVMKNWVAEEAIVRKPKGQSERIPAEKSMLNYNPPAPKEAPVPPTPEELAAVIAEIRAEADPVLRRFKQSVIRGWLAVGLVERSEVPDDVLAVPQPARPARKEPAASPACEATPQPVGGSTSDDRLDYTVNMDSRQSSRPTKEDQDAPRESSPRPAPIGRASLRTTPGREPASSILRMAAEAAIAVFPQNHSKPESDAAPETGPERRDADRRTPMRC